jgi:hypothetical protein
MQRHFWTMALVLSAASTTRAVSDEYLGFDHFSNRDGSYAAEKAVHSPLGGGANIPPSVMKHERYLRCRLKM